MPSTSKRAQRARRDVVDNEADVPDSSPSRPAKRRKRMSQTEEPAVDLPPPNPLPTERSELTLSDQDLTSAVASCLACPPPVQVSQDHSDEKHQQYGQNVSAFAKLTGRGWTYYVKVLKIVVGRPPEGTSSQAPDADATDDESTVHVDLGPSKMISRYHAEIFFDNDWHVSVHGRNGVRVDHASFTPGETAKLHSGCVIEIGGIEMMFVLPEPEGNLQVNKRYLQRAGLIPEENTENSRRRKASTPAGPPSFSYPPGRGQNGALMPIAPAPPEHRRPGTPTSSRVKVPSSAVKKSPNGYAAGGTMLMNAEDVDLSLDSNAHIKPTYSYSQMITQAIVQAPGEKLTLSGIYQYIMDRYAYYRFQAPSGWQNSIRHNLSLSKAFTKIEREKDEPGKGMKWCIKPEYQEEYKKTSIRAGRGGHRGSSQPASPINTTSRGSKEATEPGSVFREKRSPGSGSPRMSSYPPNAPQFTPDRAPQVRLPLEEFPGDGSPLPRHRRSHNGLSDNIPGSPPTLSSSYQQDDGNTFVTPAPHRVHPHLAPPSTAQRPSQHMPTSSPAPFWKFADIGNTPLKGGSAFDISPIKGSKSGLVLHPPSSSPPPMRRASAMSPTRNGPPVKLQIPDVDELEEEEERGFDLSRGFQSIGSYHAPVANNLPTPSSGLATRP
ncbi:hypothetical protein CJF32_00008975 [Rutstroemia sp. NJR-2017a WRK4]|nr:hypothetical protein CJF32_00008975 [Rutstroemia sp. NJR-2017a WRK4]